MKVSVVVPTYNRANVIERCLRSLEYQSRTPDEIVVVDDSSNDDTLSVISNLDMQTINVVEHDSNRGVSVARNTGIDKAIGDYIVFLDSDDELEPLAIEKMYGVLTNTHPECVAVFSHFDIFDEHGRKVREWDNTSGIVTKSDLMLNNVLGGISGTMFRAETLNKLDGFDEEIPKAEDTDLTFRASQLGDIYVINDSLLRVNIDSSNRISEDPKSIFEGEQAFLDKHSKKISDQYRLKRHLRSGMAALNMGEKHLASENFEEAVNLATGESEKAWVFSRIGRDFANAGYTREANKYFINSLKNDRVQPNVWLYLLLSSGGNICWNTARHLKKSVVSQTRLES